MTQNKNENENENKHLDAHQGDDKPRERNVQSKSLKSY